MTARTAHEAVARADAARGAALGRLLDELDELEAAGGSVPCRDGGVDARAWAVDDKDVAAVAARACRGCPGLEACRRYIEAHPEPAGTWAATTWKQRRRTT